MIDLDWKLKSIWDEGNPKTSNNVNWFESILEMFDIFKFKFYFFW